MRHLRRAIETETKVVYNTYDNDYYNPFGGMFGYGFGYGYGNRGGRGGRNTRRRPPVPASSSLRTATC